MLPAKKNHKIWKGATFRYPFQYQTIINGVKAAKDLTGFTANMPVQNIDTGATLLTLTDANGGVILGGASGLITIYLTDAQTGGFAWEQSKYQLTIKDPNSLDVIPLLYGRLVVVTD